MKRIWIVLAIAGIWLASCQPAPAGVQLVSAGDGAAVKQRSITVSGTAEIKVVPDQVVLSLGVQTEDMVLAAAKAKNDSVIQKVQALAKDLKVDSKDIQTDYYHIEPRYSDNYSQRTFLGYFTQKGVAITLRDVAKFDELLSRALEAGVTNVQQVNFQTSELRKYRDQARAAALQAAKEKAQAMAKELGLRAGDPLTIREESSNWYSPYSSWWGYSSPSVQNVTQNAGGSAAWQSDSGVAPGQISVTATVSVDFALQ
jgi:uncharacterized protein